MDTYLPKVFVSWVWSVLLLRLPEGYSRQIPLAVRHLPILGLSAVDSGAFFSSVVSVEAVS